MIIFRFTNNPGFGDNIRGLITLLQIKKKLNFELEVDFSHHVFSNFLICNFSNVEYQYKEYWFTDEIPRNDFLLKEISSFGNIIITTNSYPILTEIDEDIKEYIRNLFILKPNVKSYLEERLSSLPSDYHLFHYRLGDDVFENDTLNTDEIFQNFEKNKKDNAVVISDSLTFKQILNSAYENKDVYLFLNKPTHTCSGEKNMDTLIDFFLVINAKTVNCYSIYGWISNFVYWSSVVYDIPLFNLK